MGGNISVTQKSTNKNISILVKQMGYLIYESRWQLQGNLTYRSIYKTQYYWKVRIINSIVFHKK